MFSIYHFSRQLVSAAIRAARITRKNTRGRLLFVNCSQAHAQSSLNLTNQTMESVRDIHILLSFGRRRYWIPQEPRHTTHGLRAWKLGSLESS